MARRSPTARRHVRQVCLMLVLGVFLAYPLDWAVWRLRMLFGQAMISTAEVSQTTAATLKGERFEIYQQQTTTVNCSRSLLPEAGAGPCWWFRFHPQTVTQY